MAQQPIREVVRGHDDRPPAEFSRDVVGNVADQLNMPHNIAHGVVAIPEVSVPALPEISLDPLRWT